MKLKMSHHPLADARVESDPPTTLSKDDRVVATVYHDYYAAMFCFAEEMRGQLAFISRTQCAVDGQRRHSLECPKCAASKLLLQIDLEEARLLGTRPAKTPAKSCKVTSPA